MSSDDTTYAARGVADALRSRDVAQSLAERALQSAGLQASTREFQRGFVAGFDAREPEVEGHSRANADIQKQLCQRLALAEQALKTAGFTPAVSGDAWKPPLANMDRDVTIGGEYFTHAELVKLVQSHAAQAEALEKMRAELATIDRTLGNVQAFDGFRTRAEKIAFAMRTARIQSKAEATVPPALLGYLVQHRDGRTPQFFLEMNNAWLCARQHDAQKLAGTIYEATRGREVQP